MWLSDINHQWFVIVFIATFIWNLQWCSSFAGILPPLQCTWNGAFDFSPLQVSITFIAFFCCFVFFVPFFLSYLGMTLTICCCFGVCCIFTVSCFMLFWGFIPSVKETFLAFLFNHPQLQTISIHFLPFKLYTPCANNKVVPWQMSSKNDFTCGAASSPWYSDGSLKHEPLRNRCFSG